MGRQEYLDQLKYDTGDTVAKPLQCLSKPFNAASMLLQSNL